LLQDAAVRRDLEACRCFSGAATLLPNRLEAHINLANLRRRRMQYLECLDAYVKVAQLMLDEEGLVEGSPYVEPQRKIVDLMGRYRDELRAILDRNNDAGDIGAISHLQGELLMIGEEFQSAGRLAPERPFDAALRNLVREAKKIETSFLEGGLNQEPQEAFRVYAPYASALEEAFASLAESFPAETEAADMELAKSKKLLEGQPDGVRMMYRVLNTDVDVVPAAERDTYDSS